MSTQASTTAGGTGHVKMTRSLIALFAFCCGAIVANLYYAQPITELIAPDIHMSGNTASMIVSLTQIGYAFGLFFLVPLGDLLENRKLMITTALVSIVSLGAAAFAHQPGWFLAISLLVGFSSVAVQILIPLAAHLAPDESRGKVVGTIMSGLLLGILLSRPISSLVAGHFGWRAVFGSAAVLMAIVTTVLALTIPPRQPDHKATYFELIGSLGRSGPHHAGSASPLLLSGVDVRFVQSLLDRDPSRVDAAFRNLANRDRHLRAGRCDRRNLGAGGRTSGRSGPHGARDADCTRGGRLCLLAGVDPSGVGRVRARRDGHRPRFRRADEHGARPTRTLMRCMRQAETA